MESSFDSDKYSVQTVPQDESDIETQLFIEQENASKQDIIDNLQKELSICRAQFDQSVAISKKIESVHIKNQKLAISLRNLQSEKEELTRRLDISIKANEELENKLKNERFSLSQQLSKNTTDKEHELAKIKKEYDIKVEMMTKKIETLEAENQNHELNNKMISSKVDRLLQNSNQYFCNNFSELDSLLEFLAQPRIKDTNQLDEPKVIIDPNINSILEKKNRLQKQKLKILRAQIRKVMKENAQLKVNLQETEKKNKLIIQKYEDQIEQIKEDNSNSLSILNDSTNNLNLKIQKLKKENSKLKSELFELQSQKTASPPIYSTELEKPVQTQIESKKENYATFQAEIEIANQKNSELIQKLQLFEHDNSHLSTQIKELQEQKNQLEIEVENQKVALNALKVVHDETLNEVKTLRESLHTKATFKPPKPIENKILLKLKTKLEHSQKVIQLLTKQVNDLQIQRENDKNQIISIESKLSNKNMELEEIQQKNSSLNDELSTLRQINEEKPSLTAEDIIPNYAWKFNDFDQKLTQKIEKVALNPLLQPISKLNNVFKIIQKFYAEQLKEKDENGQKLTNDIQNLKLKMNKFIVDVSVILSMNPLSVSDFLNDSQFSDSIIQKLTSMVNESENLKRKDACYSMLIDLLLKYFDDEKSHNSNEFYSNPENLQLFITNLKNQLFLLNEKLKAKSHKLHTIKQCAKELKLTTDDEINSLKNIINQQSNEYITLKQNHDMLCEINQKLKKELHSSKKKFSELQQKSEENETLIQEEYDKKLLNAQTAHNLSEQSLKKQLDILLNDKENNRSAIENYETSINHLRTVIDKNQQEIREKEKKIIELSNEKDLVTNSIENKYKKEKEQLIKTYEKTVSEIKRQCENHRKDFEKVSSDLSICEKKNKCAKQSIVTLKKEKMRLENEIKAIYDQVKRDRQINEADTNNKIFSTEASFSRKLQDYKNKCENEKKRIFSYAANEFRQFFNPSETMDEKSFRSLMSRIRKEYDRLYTSDTNVRRLTGAGPHQPTEEAVAHLLS